MKLFIFAGEASGDLHGSHILSTLHATHPHIAIKGVGGPRMQAAGLTSEVPLDTFQVMGFKDVLLSLPTLTCAFYKIRNTILSWNPDAILLIDSPSFNLRLAKTLRKKGFTGKICQYICPTIWAWKSHRTYVMEKHLDLLLAILPFEPPLFANTTLPTYYVGHPLIHTQKNHPYLPFHIPQGQKLISLFPGSRKNELARNLPAQLACALKLYKQYPNLLFALSLGHEKAFSFADQLIDKEYKALRPALFYTDRTYDLMQASYAAIAKSGTVTLELALHGIPTVVTYGMAYMDALIAKYVFKLHLPYYCIVNILAQKEVFAEHIATRLNPEHLFEKIAQLIEDPLAHQSCQKELSIIKNLLGETNAHTEVVGHLCKFL